MGIEDELSKVQGTWKDTEAGGGVKLPDGNYMFQVTGATVGNSKSSGRLQVATNYRVIAGEHFGKEVPQYHGLDGAQSIGFFKQFLQRLEIAAPDDLRTLPEFLATQLVGKQFLGQVKNKGGFLNVYATKRVTVDPASIKAAEAAVKAGGAPPAAAGGAKPALGM